MPRGPTPTPITLTDPERAKLCEWARRPKTAQRLALRSRIILAAADGQANAAIAADLHVTLPTVRKWRDRFSERRLEGLADEPRPGAPPTITDRQVEAAVTRTLESRSAHATHWSTRSLARGLGLSQSAVVGSGTPSASSPTAAVHSSSRPTHSSSRRFATSSACTWRRRIGPSCCAWTRRARSRPSTAPNRSSRCCRPAPRRPRATTSATGPPRCSLLWMSRPAK